MQYLSVRLVTLLILAAIFAGCASESADEPAMDASEPETVVPQSVESGVVTVTATDYAFGAPSTFPSGWVTLRFDNQGAEPHFLLLWKLPEDRTFEEYKTDVADPFQDLYTQYREGDLTQEEFFAELTATIPEWFFEAVPMGGPGFTSAGNVSETTVYLEPGERYVLECYVRSETNDDRFHGSEGMLRPISVSEESTEMEEPEADVQITLSDSGLEVSGDLTAGSHMVKVDVVDTPAGFVRHNVHLAKLEEGQNAAEAATWLNWVDDMLPPAPAEYLGGASQTLAGSTSYVPVDLEPGRYAFVSEGRAGDEFIHEFSVE